MTVDLVLKVWGDTNLKRDEPLKVERDDGSKSEISPDIDIIIMMKGMLSRVRYYCNFGSKVSFITLTNVTVMS